MKNKKRKRFTKLEWKVIDFALSTLIANGGEDLQAFGDEKEKMVEALHSASINLPNYRL